ncbi:MAG: outer membrane lipoprotein-sorting protein [Verrucomicrobia bacterium]|nr:outer membrane lipoprotein-sorting protein [Verrucomicrobiota bacterium]
MAGNRYSFAIRGYRALLALVLVGGTGAAVRAAAESSALPDPAEIVAKVNARDDGAQVMRKATMTLKDKGGNARVRDTLSWRKYYGAEKRTVLFFLTPANIRDTAFLTFDYGDAGKDDDQWLYLPAARKVRRISATDRGGFFVGTDFTYEDIKKETKISAKDFTFKTVASEDVDGHRCVAVEATPVNEKIARELGYARATSWFDTEIWMSRRSKYFDAQGKIQRTILSQDIEQVDGVWTAKRVTATDERSGHSSEFLLTAVDYKTPVDDARFTEQALLRGVREH